jgi:hypothetical protein
LSDTDETAQIILTWAVVVSGSTLHTIDEDDLAWIVHRVPPRALGNDVSQFRHRQIGAVFLEQLCCVVLPRPAAFVALDADQRKRPLAQEP